MRTSNRVAGWLPPGAETYAGGTRRRLARDHGVRHLTDPACRDGDDVARLEEPRRVHRTFRNRPSSRS